MTAVTSVSEAFREIKESGECVAEDQILRDLISRELDAQDIPHEIVGIYNGWLIQQTE